MLHPLIAFSVPLHLPLPELSIGLRQYIVFASLMPVPEASIDKDARPVSPQHDVRFPRQSLVIEPISEPMTPEILTHYNFRLRARSPYRCHVLMSLLWGHNVGESRCYILVKSIFYFLLF